MHDVYVYLFLLVQCCFFPRGLGGGKGWFAVVYVVHSPVPKFYHQKLGACSIETLVKSQANEWPKPLFSHANPAIMIESFMEKSTKALKPNCSTLVKLKSQPVPTQTIAFLTISRACSRLPSLAACNNELAAV